MKLIIDIPQKEYKACVWRDVCMTGGIADSYIAQGIPYEERPQGKWIFIQGVTCGGYYKCNKCGEVERAEKNYCSNCGSEMKGKEE